MNYIVDYQPTHYKFYLKKCEKILDNSNDIDTWIKTISLKHNIVWIKAIKNLKKNVSNFNEESSILITLVICLFMLELDIENNEIKLSNTEIKKLLLRFEQIVRLEYGYKRELLPREGHKHTLLKDTE